MKPDILFKKSKEMELYNYYYAINKRSYGADFSKSFSRDFIEKIKGKAFEDVKDVLKQKICEDYSRQEEKIDVILWSVKERWEKIENEFFKRLEKIFGKPFLAKNVVIYATILNRCDYNCNVNDAFLKISIQWPESSLKTIMHELLHFMFHWHYWDFCKKI